MLNFETKQILFSSGEVKNMTFEEVREEFLPLAKAEMYKANSKFIYNKVEEDDFMQEMEIEIWRAYNQYDFDKGNCFSTYLYFKLMKGVRNATYYKYAQKNQNNGIHSIHSEFGDSDTTLEDFLATEDTNLGNIEYEELVEIINNSLLEGEDELLLIILDVKNNPVQAYADKYGITRQAANQRVLKLKRKLREEISKNYLFV